MQKYGELDPHFYDNQAILEKEEMYLLFLSDYPNSPSSLLSGIYDESPSEKP